MEENSHMTLYAKMLQAQRQMKNPQKGATNPAYKSKYATLDAVLAIVRPALHDAGLLLVQSPIIIDGQQWLESYVMDTDGTKMELGTIRIIDGTPQQVGSAITYARRYTLLSAFGLVGDDDDDGNSASKGPTKPTPAAKSKNPHLAIFGQMANTYAEESGTPLTDICTLVSERMGMPLANVQSEEEAATAEAILQEIINTPQESMF